MNTIKHFLARYGTAFAFLLLAGAGMYAVNAQANSNAQTLYDTQIAACNRGNKIRTESNDRIAAHTIDRNVLSSFLESAEIARRASGTKTDLAAAAQYNELRDSLERVQFTSQPPIDCEATIEKP